LKITILSENRKKGACEAEFGLSLFIEFSGAQFLFDTGESDLFLKNAEILGVNADCVNTVVLSHGHYDHSNGLQYLTDGKRVVMHPNGFKKRFSIDGIEYTGFPIEKEHAMERFDFELAKTPLEIFENIWFLGEIPRNTTFEGIGRNASVLDTVTRCADYTEDDSAVVIKTEKGLFIISGCGHSGICNIIEYAKKVTGTEEIYGALGGFHLDRGLIDESDLAGFEETVVKTCEYFKENKVKIALLGHCIEDSVIAQFERELMGITEVRRMFSGAEFEEL